MRMFKREFAEMGRVQRGVAEKARLESLFAESRKAMDKRMPVATEFQLNDETIDRIDSTPGADPVLPTVDIDQQREEARQLVEARKAQRQEARTRMLAANPALRTPTKAEQVAQLMKDVDERIRKARNGNESPKTSPSRRSIGQTHGGKKFYAAPPVKFASANRPVAGVGSAGPAGRASVLRPGPTSGCVALSETEYHPSTPRTNVYSRSVRSRRLSIDGQLSQDYINSERQAKDDRAAQRKLSMKRSADRAGLNEKEEGPNVKRGRW